MIKEKRGLLDMFIYKGEYPTYDFMIHPFTIGKYSYATNGKIIFYCPKLDYLKECSENEKGKILGVIPVALNCDLEIQTELLQQAIQKTPFVNAPCESCGGSKEVLWEYEHYSKLFDCPVCYGTGISDDEEHKVFDHHYKIQIIEHRFSVEFISKIVMVANALKVDKVKLIHQQTEGFVGGSLFKISDCFMFMMPCYHGNEDKVLELIK